MMTLVLRKHKRQIVRINLCLLVSWTIEVLLWLGYSVVSLTGRLPPFYAFVALVLLKVFRAVNFIIFLALIFRLKALTVYMHEDNNSEEKIKTQLKRVKDLRAWLIFFYAVSFMPF